MFCFPGGRAGDAPRTVAAHPPGVLDSVDLLVEPLAGLAAENGGTERDGERREQRDEAAGRQGAAGDGQPRGGGGRGGGGEGPAGGGGAAGAGRRGEFHRAELVVLPPPIAARAATT